MKITITSIVGDIVANNYKTAEIFKNYEIDFCCGGQQSIEDVGKKENLSTIAVANLVKEINNFLEEKDAKQTIDYRNWPLDKLTDHIETTHHAYVEAKIPVLKTYLDKIESVHGKDHPELAEINSIFIDASGQLAMHMKKEELVLFPFIRKIAKAKREGTTLEVPHFGTIKNPIKKMDEEHDFEGEAFKKIAALSNNYQVPEDACNTYKVTFGLLQEFEDNLHLHIHKENNILFQKAIKLEEELLS